MVSDVFNLHPYTMYGACGFYSEQNFPLTDGRDCTEGSNKKWSEQRGNDVYLLPDNVVILPNGGGILTPAKIRLFGYDLTAVLKVASLFCFSMCVVLLAVEVYYCFTTPKEWDEEEEALAQQQGQYGTTQDVEAAGAK